MPTQHNIKDVDIIKDVTIADIKDSDRMAADDYFNNELDSAFDQFTQLAKKRNSICESEFKDQFIQLYIPREGDIPEAELPYFNSLRDKWAAMVDINQPINIVKDDDETSIVATLMPNMYSLTPLPTELNKVILAFENTSDPERQTATIHKNRHQQYADLLSAILVISNGPEYLAELHSAAYQQAKQGTASLAGDVVDIPEGEWEWKDA